LKRVCPSHDPSPTQMYTLSLHDALPISGVVGRAQEPQLLARKRDEDNAALQVAPPCRERRSQLEDCGSAGGVVVGAGVDLANLRGRDRKSTRLNSSHVAISYAVFCLKKKK